MRPVVEIGVGQHIQGPANAFITFSGRESKRLVHRVLDGGRPELRSGGAEGLVVDVDQVLTVGVYTRTA